MNHHEAMTPSRRSGNGSLRETAISGAFFSTLEFRRTLDTTSFLEGEGSTLPGWELLEAVSFVLQAVTDADKTSDETMNVSLNHM